MVFKLSFGYVFSRAGHLGKPPKSFPPKNDFFKVICQTGIFVCLDTASQKSQTGKFFVLEFFAGKLFRGTIHNGS
ncbi:MAG: hypothetical protein WC608_00080 [Parcubacteria group bacterium]